MALFGTNWKKVEPGASVIVVFDGEERLGKFLHVGSGRDKGKLRIALDGDDAKYREIPIKNVKLAPLPEEKTPAAEPVVTEVKVERVEPPKEVSEADKVKQKVRDFVAGCDQHVTKEELQRFAGGL